MKNPEAIRTELETLAASLVVDLSSIARHDVQTGDWEAIPEAEKQCGADDNLIADEIETWNERRATAAVLETRYRNVMRALDKIATGTYGICEISGEPIEAERLIANPAARTCIQHLDDEATLPL